MGSWPRGRQAVKRQDGGGKQCRTSQVRAGCVSNRFVHFWCNVACGGASLLPPGVLVSCGSGEGVAGRAPLEPPSELATLEEYRTRHRLFRTDAALVEMMRRAPVIAIW
jgi:hypothetical protein